MLLNILAESLRFHPNTTLGDSAANLVYTVTYGSNVGRPTSRQRIVRGLKVAVTPSPSYLFLNIQTLSLPDGGWWAGLNFVLWLSGSKSRLDWTVPAKIEEIECS